MCETTSHAIYPVSPDIREMNPTTCRNKALASWERAFENGVDQNLGSIRGFIPLNRRDQPYLSI
jgi:hypothetical protein